MYVPYLVRYDASYNALYSRLCRTATADTTVYVLVLSYAPHCVVKSA